MLGASKPKSEATVTSMASTPCLCLMPMIRLLSCFRRWDMIHKKKGKLTGWLSYTWSKVTNQFEALNNGRSFFPASTAATTFRWWVFISLVRALRRRAARATAICFPEPVFLNGNVADNFGVVVGYNPTIVIKLFLHCWNKS